MYLSKLNREKILNPNVLLFLVLGCLLLSFYNIYNIKMDYANQDQPEIVDGTEYKYYFKKELLTQERINEVLDKYSHLTLPKDSAKIDVSDRGIVEIVTKVYGEDLKNIQRNDFYIDRMKEMEKSAGKPVHSMFSTDNPIEIGYAEGWKNASISLRTATILTLLVLAILCMPIFNEDKTLGIDPLIRSTKFGKKRLNNLRIRNAIQLSITVYCLIVFIYALPIFIFYGMDGFHLPIQSAMEYCLSEYNINYLTQFLVNFGIGYLLVLFITILSLVISTFIDEVSTGYVSILFVGVVSKSLEFVNNTSFHHYIGNFLPLGVLNFNSYYTSFETYFGISKISSVVIVLIVLTMLFTVVLVLIINTNRFLNKVQ